MTVGDTTKDIEAQNPGGDGIPEDDPEELLVVIVNEDELENESEIDQTVKLKIPDSWEKDDPTRRKTARRPRRLRRPRDEFEKKLESEIEQELADGKKKKPTAVSSTWMYRSFALLATGLLAILFYIGWKYYTAPLTLRPLHYLHNLLRPSGLLGLPLGIAGTVLMLATAGYMFRKRMLSIAKLGSLRGWLDFHIFAGLVGPALILFHAAFVPHSAIGALAFCSMLVVVASGVIGRYIFVSVPKSLEGRELEFDDLRRRLGVYREKLLDLGVDARLLRNERKVKRKREWLWLFHALVGVLYGDRDSRSDYDRVRKAVEGRSELNESREQILVLSRKLCRERQWLTRYRELRKLMGAWRFFHGWVGVILLAAVFYHVIVATKFGQLWILKGVD